MRRLQRNYGHRSQNRTHNMLQNLHNSTPLTRLPRWTCNLDSRLLWLSLLLFVLCGCKTVPVPVCPAPHSQPDSLRQAVPQPDQLDLMMAAIKCFETGCSAMPPLPKSATKP